MKTEFEIEIEIRIEMEIKVVLETERWREFLPLVCVVGKFCRGRALYIEIRGGEEGEVPPRQTGVRRLRAAFHFYSAVI